MMRQIRNGRGRQGQVLVITVLVLSVAALAAGTIASFLTITQIRQARGISDSTKAVYAADSGIEYGLYRAFVDSEYPLPVMTNGPNISFEIDTTNDAVIRSLGQANNSFRAFSVSF
jgi:hypothetical protein